MSHITKFAFFEIDQITFRTLLEVICVATYVRLGEINSLQFLESFSKWSAQQVDVICAFPFSFTTPAGGPSQAPCTNVPSQKQPPNSCRISLSKIPPKFGMQISKTF